MHKVTTQVDVTNIVICDICNADHSATGAVGGMLFESKGVCPDCVPRFLASVKQYGEEHFIRGRANEGETFRDFIVRIRNGNNIVTVTGPADDPMHDIVRENLNRKPT